MNQRIKKKLNKRFGKRTYREYYGDLIEKACLKAIELYKESVDEDLGHCIAYTVTSKNKKHIHKLQLFTNCRLVGNSSDFEYQREGNYKNEDFLYHR